jgi:hypothetical protein
VSGMGYGPGQGPGAGRNASSENLASGGSYGGIFIIFSLSFRFPSYNLRKKGMVRLIRAILLSRMVLMRGQQTLGVGVAMLEIIQEGLVVESC